MPLGWDFDFLAQSARFTRYHLYAASGLSGWRPIYALLTLLLWLLFSLVLSGASLASFVPKFPFAAALAIAALTTPVLSSLAPSVCSPRVLA